MTPTYVRRPSIRLIVPILASLLLNPVLAGLRSPAEVAPHHNEPPSSQQPGSSQHSMTQPFDFGGDKPQSTPADLHPVHERPAGSPLSRSRRTPSPPPPKLQFIQPGAPTKEQQRAVTAKNQAARANRKAERTAAHDAKREANLHSAQERVQSLTPDPRHALTAALTHRSPAATGLSSDAIYDHAARYNRASNEHALLADQHRGNKEMHDHHAGMATHSMYVRDTIETIGAAHHNSELPNANDQQALRHHLLALGHQDAAAGSFSQRKRLEARRVGNEPVSGGRLDEKGEIGRLRQEYLGLMDRQRNAHLGRATEHSEVGGRYSALAIAQEDGSTKETVGRYQTALDERLKKHEQFVRDAPLGDQQWHGHIEQRMGFKKPSVML